MFSHNLRALGVGLSALAFIASTAPRASATEGYFVQGVGAREEALGGTGVADSKDALTIANNPAGLVDVGRQLNVDVSIFNPDRDYSASGTVLVAPGTVNSGRPAFVIPSIGYSQPLSADESVGIALYGNGGMDTSYTTSAAGYACPRGASGVFCSGRAGVDLQQAFIALAYARKFGNVSVGVAPVLAVQLFQAYGLGAFGSFGLSAQPRALSDNGVDTAVGGGVRAGAQWKVNESLSLGVAGTTPIWSSNFTKYAGLFAGDGGFDIPAEIGAGVAYHYAPTLTFLLDYKHIFYSSIPSVGDPLTYRALLGSGGGPGFGWRDVNVVAFGVEWQARENLILRAGYSWNNNPITSQNVTINILAPGVITNHVSGGFTYAVDRNSSIDFAAVFGLRSSVSGPEVTPYGTTPGSNITIAMNQFVATLGYTYHFDAPAPVVIAKY
jgi:long-chain fatty acid transport protein